MTVAGTLSFLFADIRDYTAFVERHGDAAAAGLLADDRRLVRAEVARAGGGEIKTEGERSARDGDLGAAIAFLDQTARHFSEIPCTRTAAEWARLRRAELLLQRAAPGDWEAAQAELDAALAYWRKAKATWYLGKLKEWAAEHGLRFPEN